LENRSFLPQEIWGKYLENYSDLFQLEHQKAALHSLNEYVTDALKHTPSCLDYLSEITSPSIFRFCAIPQVMAIATLSLCYNNYNVFLESVKIPRFESIRIMTSSSNYPNTLNYYAQYAKRLVTKIPAEDPNADIIAKRLAEIIMRHKKLQYLLP
jgi:farnesyl-diphosphate farnesyltransferase